MRGRAHSNRVCTERDTWGTPVDFYARLDRIFHFNLDAAATAQNTLCDHYITPEQDALTVPWLSVNTVRSRAWCNPPYSRGWKEAFCEKAIEEVRAGHAEMVAMLLPINTADGYWTQWVTPHAAEILFVEGRLKFKGAPSCADFPSAVVIYRAHIAGPAFGTIKAREAT
ncbi:MAG: DNA N-6-adenine-methyltransferase [Gemmatimonadaceae bacterium]|jgi:site-specific DNA-methyltransferase (adenine-specific)